MKHIKDKMTQEQRATRGSIVIFILSIVLILCLTLTATLAYFAGEDTSSTTLVIGGPVTVGLYDGEDNKRYGSEQLVMGLTDASKVKPGMGIDISASARVFSSDIDPTEAILRAVVGIEVNYSHNMFISQATLDYVTRSLPSLIKSNMLPVLHNRIDASRMDGRDGWVYYEGDFYYCKAELEDNEIVLSPIVTNSEGKKVWFMQGVFAMPSTLTNDYSALSIKITLTFQAIQKVLVDDDGVRMKNTLHNVKTVLDSFTEDDWRFQEGY